ncbi:MAG: alanine--glyoxylate aminotransferase family protein [Cyanobacteria bacterium]|nr:alanine--glyoxylate aminotransferase family protein [Cyanobacteriota bacterium]
MNQQSPIQNQNILAQNSLTQAALGTPERPFLMIPGPTPLPEAVRAVLGEPAIGHRSAEFKTVLARVFAGLQWAFQTQNPVLMYTASATGAMEGAFQNTLNPGDQIVVLCCGVFSARWADMGESLGLQVTRISVPAGEPNTVESLEAVLTADTARKIKAVVLTHSETSTGVLNPLEAMAKVVRAHGALCIVDAVTSLLATPFYTDTWDLDLVVSGSQKGFMIPPGLAFLSVGPRAWEAFERCTHPGYYFNFERNKKAQQDNNTAYTPATPQCLALDVALSLMQQEGLEAIWARHQKLQTQIRDGVEALGLSCLVPHTQYASTAVTAVYPPVGVSVSSIRTYIKQHYAMAIADGQKELKGKIFRIGHLGHISSTDAERVLGALEAFLKEDR